MNERQIFTPLIQVQIRASLVDGGSRIEGMITNYGRFTATDVSLLVAGREVARYPTLAIQDPHEIDMIIPVVQERDPVVAQLQHQEYDMRQQGKFEPAHGHPGWLLMKGLGSRKLALAV